MIEKANTIMLVLHLINILYYCHVDCCVVLIKEGKRYTNLSNEFPLRVSCRHNIKGALIK